jgi:hypothetical protein
VLPEEPKAASDRGLCFVPKSKINCKRGDAKNAEVRKEVLFKEKPELSANLRVITASPFAVGFDCQYE